MADDSMLFEMFKESGLSTSTIQDVLVEAGGDFNLAAQYLFQMIEQNASVAGNVQVSPVRKYGKGKMSSVPSYSSTYTDKNNQHEKQPRLNENPEDIASTSGSRLEEGIHRQTYTDRDNENKMTEVLYNNLRDVASTSGSRLHEHNFHEKYVDKSNGSEMPLSTNCRDIASTSQSGLEESGLSLLLEDLRIYLPQHEDVELMTALEAMGGDAFEALKLLLSVQEADDLNSQDQGQIDRAYASELANAEAIRLEQERAQRQHIEQLDADYAHALLLEEEVNHVDPANYDPAAYARKSWGGRAVERTPQVASASVPVTPIRATSVEPTRPVSAGSKSRQGRSNTLGPASAGFYAPLDGLGNREVEMDAVRTSQPAHKAADKSLDGFLQDPSTHRKLLLLRRLCVPGVGDDFLLDILRNKKGNAQLARQALQELDLLEKQEPSSGEETEIPGRARNPEFFSEDMELPLPVSKKGGRGKRQAVDVPVLMNEPDTYVTCRKNAFQITEERARLNQRINQAEAGGNKDLARKLREQAKHLAAEARTAHMEAAKRIYEKKNARLRNIWVVDLHGLHVEEALKSVKDTIAQFQGLPSQKVIRFITGRGAHSGPEGPKIKVAVGTYLAQVGNQHGCNVIEELGYYDLIMDPASSR